MHEPTLHNNGVARHTVFVIDDDPQSHQTVSAALADANVKVQPYNSAEEFLGAFSPNGPACMLVDEGLPGMPGSQLLQVMDRVGINLPAVVLADKATTPFTVSAMRLGASSVLDKPCTDEQLRVAVDEALQDVLTRRERERNAAEAKEKISQLSSSERQVLDMVLTGTPNKQIAEELAVCVRTVEARRSRIYQTTQVGSVAELVRLCVAAGVIEP